MTSYYHSCKRLIPNEVALTAHSSGVATITARDLDAIPASTIVTVSNPASTVETRFGRAMVIAGGGSHTNNTLFPYTDELSRRMYKLLKSRGYTDADIVYFTPMEHQDLDGDGFNDNQDGSVVDYLLFDPLTELQQAISEIAPTLLPGQQFVLYLHGHGFAEPEVLQLNRTTDISSSALRDLLAQIPAHAQQVIILDTCHSGGFLDELAGENRTILTSANKWNVAWNTRQENFSDSLISSLRRGMNVLEAYETAERLIRRNGLQFDQQRPQLDDSGDGLYNTRDGLLAARTWLGRPGVSANPPPDIVQVHPVIQADSNGALLWVKTYPAGDERIRKVRARLMQPAGVTSALYNGIATDFASNEALLCYNAEQDRYQVQHQHFPQTGQWRVAYQAQDIQGVWSDIAVGEVEASQIVTPSDSAPACQSNTSEPTDSNPAALSISAGTNQSSYQIGDKLQFSLHTKNGDTARYDLYAALIFPESYFVTFAYPFSMNFPNTIQAYQTDLDLSGDKDFVIFEVELPRGLALGDYQGCGIVAPAGSDPWDTTLWTSFHCQGFAIQ